MRNRFSGVFCFLVFVQCIVYAAAGPVRAEALSPGPDHACEEREHDTPFGDPDDKKRERDSAETISGGSAPEFDHAEPSSDQLPPGAESEQKEEPPAESFDLGRSEPVSAQDRIGFKSYKIAAGLVVNAAAFGVHFEYRFIPYIGVKFMFLNIFGLALQEGDQTLDQGEFLLAGLLGPSLHFPVKKNIIDPYLFLGMLYSHFHWEHDTSGKVGDIRDLTFAWGLGLGFRLTSFLDVGFNIWCNYDYKVDWSDIRADKGRRIVMVLPYLSVKFLF
jgi:hypothetical protein